MSMKTLITPADFGDLLAKLRKSRGLTQKAFAEKIYRETGLRYYQPHISDAESGRNVALAKMLLEHLGCSFSPPRYIVTIPKGEVPFPPHQNADPKEVRHEYESA